MPVLFFILGLLGGWMKSDLNVPDQIGRYLALYLMVAIGFKGGASLFSPAESNYHLILLTSIFAILCGLLQPAIGFFFLKCTTRLDTPTAAAVSAHYGSISLVTFVTAISYLEMREIDYNSSLIAIAALLEVPAILAGLFLARHDQKTSEKNLPWKHMFTNGAVVLLLGSFVIGLLTGTKGTEKMEGFLITPFYGFLAFFLLDMGLRVANQLRHTQGFSFSLCLFALYMPLLGAALGLGGAILLGLGAGSATLLIVLLASASYIAVPAAMQIALPKAQASIYLPLSLGLTFPINVMVGIPVYTEIALTFLN